MDDFRDIRDGELLLASQLFESREMMLKTQSWLVQYDKVILSTATVPSGTLFGLALRAHDLDKLLQSKAVWAVTIFEDGRAQQNRRSVEDRNMSLLYLGK